MPLFKADEKLIFYAHVPKCGGSAVSWYLGERFGAVAFNDSAHTRQPAARRWTRTSPQHVDAVSLSRLFPEGFFDAVFTIVRHPVPRLVSAYQFQLDVEKSIPESTSFSDWLADVEERLEEDPFVFDNHVRPMDDIVPAGAQVFHMEHGLDGLVGWFDALTGRRDAPRALPRINEQGQYTGTRSEKARPSEADLARIARLYAADFARFGYRPEDAAPAAAAPTLSAAALAERDAALKQMKGMNSTLSRVRRKIGARLRL
jgi:hypothetical protein